jgi:hypothetical protein
MSATEGHFKSNNHALSTGLFIGFLTRKGIAFTVEMAEDDENYTPRLTVHLDDLDADIAIEVIPPEEDVL